MMENGPVEIVDLPMKNGAFVQFAKCQRLPGRVPFIPHLGWLA